MYKVIKRDGSVVDFDIQKIKRAIIKAFESVDRSYTDDIIDFIVLKVTADFEKKLNKETGTLGAEYKHDTIAVEDIQDSVETVLIKSGYDQVAKSFILYREKHAKMRAVKNTLMDYKKTMEQYLGGSDWRVKENSTVGYSVGGLILNQSGAMTANYWLSEVYDGEIAAAHRNCDMHIHDLCMLAPYCCGHDLKQLIREGLGGVPGKISSAPAGHLSTLCNQMVNYLGISQNEAAGAQAFSNFDTLLAPFVKKDNLSYKEVKQCIQSFVFGLNTPSRWGCVPETYKVMTVDGWKGIDELKAGDLIYTWKDGRMNVCANNATVIKEHDGELVCFESPMYGYKQEVTPYHRVMYYPTDKVKCDIRIDTAEVVASSEIVNNYRMPTKFTEPSFLPDAPLSDDEIKLAAMMYTDGSIRQHNKNGVEVRYTKSVKRRFQFDPQKVFDALGMNVEPKHHTTPLSKSGVYVWGFYGENANRIINLIGQKNKIDEKFLHMSQRQARIFLDIWMLHDGVEEYHMAQYDNKEISESLLFINALAGNMARTVHEYHKPQDCTVNYVKTVVAKMVKPVIRKKQYKGRVWCPSSDDGTAIFMNDSGGIFISANCQAPFTNVSIDWTCPKDFKDLPAVVGGVEQDFTYGDCTKEQEIINKAFIEVMLEGDCNGRGHQYPIPTYSITRDFKWDDSENNRLLFGMAAKYGIPYFSNYINSDMDPSETRAMCCRLRLDLREVIKKNGGGLFGAAAKTGSIGVVTLNMARLGYLAKDEEDFFKRLDHLMDVAARSLDIKRKVVTQFLDNGLYPYMKRYLGSFKTYFSTLATVGMNEMCLNAKWLRAPISDKKGQEFTIKTLKHMVSRIPMYQQEYGALYNLESAPAESTCYRLAKHDKEKYPDIITAGTDKVPYYTNSSNMAVGTTANIYEALENQDPIQILYTSGTVFHAYLGESLPDWKAAATIIKKICENYRLPYITLSPTYSVCPEHGYIKGEHHTCPICTSKQEDNMI